MSGLLIGIFIYCIAIYVVLYWFLGNIKSTLEDISKLLEKVVDKERYE